MGSPVGLRASKEEFMAALGLDVRNRDHERYYQAMRDETIAVYRELGKADLLDNQRNDPNIQPPFYWHHVRQDRIRWATAEIWRRAGPMTRAFFSHGRSPNGDEGSNWVIGWLLYSVFRSRDERNRRRKNDDKSPPSSNGSGGPGLGGYSQGTFYDPVKSC
ncbi:hypothetical protein VTO42DRAFT_5019 [Malbranchea cinnamomea]